MPPTIVLEVLEAGLLTTVQDAGRPDSVQLGVPRGGACDPWSLRVANVLAGNEPDAPALEMTLVGASLRLLDDCVIGLAGADLGGRVLETDNRLRPGTAMLLRRGQTVAFGSAPEQAGVRAYLALAGGVAVPRILGSGSTCLVGGFGGLDGRPLVVGDFVRAGSGDLGGVVDATSLAETHWHRGPQPAREASLRPIRVLPGPHLGSLAARAFERFVAAEYRVSARGDRQAIVLQGPTLRGRPGAGTMLSQGVIWGAVQVTPDGRPICLLADHQTVGGYPVVATVIRADLPLLGQLGPGDPVRFGAVSSAEAVRLLGQQERAWQEGLDRLQGRT